MFTHRVRRGFCAVVGSFFLLRGIARGDEPPGNDAAQNDNALPGSKVGVFNSGLGYFEHRGQVENDAKIELQFRVDNVNDLLKSMVLEDRDGKAATVSYGSRDPITKTLKTFPIDLTANPTLAGILDQVRGQRLQID